MLNERLQEDTPLDCAAFNGRVEVVQVLLAAGADMNAKGKIGDTPLLSAARGFQKRRVQVVQLLLAAGADANACNDYEGSTPLHHAAIYGQVEVVQALLAVGADINARNEDGRTPLSLAKQAGHSSVVMLLQGGVPLSSSVPVHDTAF